MKSFKIFIAGIALILAATVTLSKVAAEEGSDDVQNPRLMELAPRTTNRETEDSVRGRLEDVRDKLETRLDRREDRQEDRREDRREDRMSNLREMQMERERNFAEHKSELENRLTIIRDEQKKNRVRRVNEELNRLNARLTGHFSDVLEQLEKVLEKIEGRTERATARGRNTASVEEMIVKAGTALDAAHANVIAQAEMTYEIGSFTSDAELRVAVKAQRDMLREDIEKTRDAVFEARTAVHTVAQELARITQEESSQNGSSDE